MKNRKSFTIEKYDTQQMMNLRFNTVMTCRQKGL